MDDEFVTFVEYFIQLAHPSKAKPIMFSPDNHGLHLSVETIQFAKENRILMRSFLPHCSHRLQPLDRSVYGPFKRFISTAQDSWLRTHPGKHLNFYDIPSLVLEALPKSFTPTNIINGFQACGICPFNQDIFTESDYAPSVPTDQP